MLIHVILYKWKEDVTPDKVQKVLDGVQKLKEVVDGIVDIYSGENIGKHNKGYTHAIVVVAQDEDALQRYKEHPLHHTLAHEVAAIKDDGVGVDFLG